MIANKVRKEDPNAKTTIRNLAKIERRCDEILENDPRASTKARAGLGDDPRVLWFVTFGYVAYAFQLFGVREAVGMPAAAASLLDHAEKAVSLIAVAAATIFTTGQMF